MKKLTKSFLIVLRWDSCMSVNVMADVQTGKTEPDYKHRLLYDRRIKRQEELIFTLSLILIQPG